MDDQEKREPWQGAETGPTPEPVENELRVRIALNDIAVDGALPEGYVALVLVRRPDGMVVDMWGPLADRLLCFGMLEEGTAIVRKWHLDQRRLQLNTAAGRPPTGRVL